MTGIGDDNITGRFGAAVMDAVRDPVLGASPVFIGAVLDISAERGDLDVLLEGTLRLFLAAAREVYSSQGMLKVRGALIEIGNHPTGDRPLHAEAAAVIMSHITASDVLLDVDFRERAVHDFKTERGWLEKFGVSTERLVLAVIAVWTELLPTLDSEDIRRLGAEFEAD